MKNKLMRNLIFSPLKSLVFIIFVSISFCSQGTLKAQKNIHKKMEWWTDARFGMFIHWGPYAVYGGVYQGHQARKGGSAWLMNRCKVPVEDYMATAATFNPVKYDPEAWVKLAKEAGMKYIVFTAKHHDGFAMFKSNASSFNIVDHTPFKRDVLKELADACRKHNMPLGLYYSQSQDWCHPGGATARRPMNQGWANPDSVAIDKYTAEHDGAWDPIQTSRTFDEYMYEIAIPQIKEIFSNYGDIAVVWWDTPTVKITAKHAGDIVEILKEHPKLIMNDRLIRPANSFGDYKTPEGLIPKQKEVEGVYWETCMKMSDSWGYMSWDNKWKSSTELIKILTKVVSRGGNFLLNVGPDSEGVIPEKNVTRLKDVSSWMKENGETIYKGLKSPIKEPKWGVCIRHDKGKYTELHLVVYELPKNGKLDVEMPFTVDKVLLNKKSLNYQKGEKKIIIDLPLKMLDEKATVLKVILKEKLPPLKISYNSEKSFEIIDGN